MGIFEYRPVQIVGNFIGRWPWGRRILEWYFTGLIERRRKYEVSQPCVNGRCVEFIDSRNGRVLGGAGPAGCGCC